ncbi:unnamed protein product, partial [Owenia fusiformis]
WTMPRFKINDERHKAKKPTCSLEFLKEYFLKTGEFYSSGSWDDRSWIANDCIQADLDLPTMLKRNNLSSILFLGDSTAWRYARAFVNVLKKRFTCHLVKQEGSGKEPDVTYFSDSRGVFQADMLVHSRDCYTCKSFMYECKNIVEFSHVGSYVIIEYVSMEYFMDTEISTLRLPTNKNKNMCRTSHNTQSGLACGQSPTSQEFIFNEYLTLKPSESYPQLIALVSNFHELIMRDDVSFRRTLTWFLDLVYQSTKSRPGNRVMWFEPTFFIESKKNRNIVKNAQTKNHRLNNIAKELLMKYFNENIPIFWPFFGVMNISKVATPEWNIDGIHFEMMYYESMIKLLLQTLST